MSDSEGSVKRSRGNEETVSEESTDNTSRAPCVKRYRKVDEISHVLARPGIWIGSTEPVRVPLEILILDDDKASLDHYASTHADLDIRFVEQKNPSAVMRHDLPTPSLSSSPTLSIREEDYVPEPREGMGEALVTVESPPESPVEMPSQLTKHAKRRVCLLKEHLGSGTLWAPHSYGLQRLLIEALQNALDASLEDPTLTKIEVIIDDRNGRISVKNNGKGIPVEKTTHGVEQDVLVPDLVFGHLRAGSNFGDVEGGDGKTRAGSGMNGVGITLANIFSTWFRATCHSVDSQKMWTKTWLRNSRESKDVSIKNKKCKRGQVTVEFKPELQRFGMGVSGTFPPHVACMLRGTALDLIPVLPKHVHLCLDGRRIPARGLLDYGRCMCGVLELSKRMRFVHVATEPSEEGCLIEFIVTLSTAKCPTRPLGFINGIRCSGGSHMDLVADVLRDELKRIACDSKAFEQVSITRDKVKQLLWFCVNARVLNPKFKSQTKEELDMSVKSLGLRLELTSTHRTALGSMLKQVLKFLKIEHEVQRDALALQRAAKVTTVSKQKGGLSGSVVHHPKLQDAPRAGPRRSMNDLRKLVSAAQGVVQGKKPYIPRGGLRRLYVCEGDSAGELVKCGLVASKDPENCGVLAARGKILNVRNSETTVVTKNEFIMLLCRTLGLSPAKPVEDVACLKDLRYDIVVGFADQDGDGHHIVGLIANALEYLFPGLLRLRPDFLRRFATPVVRCGHRVRTKPDRTFLTLQEFTEWYKPAVFKDYPRNRVRYLKGLGGSERPEALEYFRKEQELCVTLSYTGIASSAALHVLFNNALADQRKRMLAGTPPVADAVEKECLRKTFMGKGASGQGRVSTMEECIVTGSSDVGELGHMQVITQACQDLVYKPDQTFDYSVSSAPLESYVSRAVAHFSWEDVERSLPDLSGFKEVHRKILHGFFKKKIVSLRKVTIAIAECTATSHYTHGENSITEAAIGMAQCHLGTNNVAVLRGSGMFGTRNNASDKHTAPRYLSIELSTIAPLIFPQDDAAIIDYRLEEGHLVEPYQFSPVVPLVLINGSNGIATGWSTYVPPMNPLEVLQTCRDLVQITKQVTRTMYLSKWGPWAENSTEEIAQTWYDQAEKIKAGSSIHSSAVSLQTGEQTMDTHLQSLCPHLYECLRNVAEDQRVQFNEQLCHWAKAADFLVPWTDMYKGGVCVEYDTKYTNSPVRLTWVGSYSVQDNMDGTHTVLIDELPRGEWTTPWKQARYVKNFITPPPNVGTVPLNESKKAKSMRFIQDMQVLSTDVSVKITLLCDSERILPFLTKQEGVQPKQGYVGCMYPGGVRTSDTSGSARFPDLEKVLRLQVTESLENMHIFDHALQLRRFRCFSNIFLAHHSHRYCTYVRRMHHLFQARNREYLLASNKYRFVSMIVKNELSLVNKTLAHIDKELAEHGFTTDDDLLAATIDMDLHEKPLDQESGFVSAEEPTKDMSDTGAEQDATGNAPSFLYLRRLPIDSMSKDMLSKLQKEMERCKSALDTLKKQTPEDLWLHDLDVLWEGFRNYEKAKHVEYFSSDHP